MSNTPDVITIAEMADIFGIARGAEPALEQELRREGYAIVEDWAGRHSVSFRDAKKKVDQVRKSNREHQEQRDREYALKAAINNAWRDRLEILERVFSEEMMKQMHPNDPKAEKAAYKAAVEAVRAAEADLPDDIKRRLSWPRPGQLERRF